MIVEMKQRGGLLTKFDLAGYESKIDAPLSIALPNGYTIVGPGQPSSFSAIGLIAEIMTGRYLNQTGSPLSVIYLRDLLMAQRLGMVRLEQTGT
ncbi:hypothetical protein OESDEN_19228 [Oesophagostomum dentatum]|uniref:Gamma-glutamyltranspeptidase n=1 Tax=Oesophagostomum dentatum TaxID=61180 RepID=A0A0B1S6X6_OESDE|nr:hypothetical protein OESDEN_19228 [Oesophagostomum dentatum]